MIRLALLYILLMLMLEHKYKLYKSHLAIIPFHLFNNHFENMIPPVVKINSHKHTHVQKTKTSYRVITVVHQLLLKAQRNQVDIQSPISIETEGVEVDGKPSFILGRRSNKKWES